MSGTQNKGKGKGSRGGGNSQTGSASNQSSIPNLQEEAGIKEVIRMLMQVSIRHEDHINLLRLDRSFLLWMKTSSPETMLPNIVAASKAWKEKREAGTTDTSLRVTLFRCLLVELKNRATGESGAARKAGHDRLASSEGWTGTHVESHDVEQNGGEGNSGARPGTHGSVGCPLADRQALGGNRLAHTSTFPLHKATDRRLPQRDGVLSSGDLESRHHGHKAPSGTGDTLSLLSDVPDRRSPSTRNPEALPSDRQDVQSSLFLVLHLALHNPDNICYQNSFALALIWTYLHTHLQEGREHGRGRGTITEAFCSAILTLRPTALASLQVWTDLLRGWRQPHRQHDVCEFACFVLAKLRPNMLQGEWSARRHDSELGEFDHGCLFNPIPLRIPANAHSIQDCISFLE